MLLPAGQSKFNQEVLADVAFESEMTDEHGDLSGPLKILEDSSRLGAELNRLSEPMGDRESSRVKSSQALPQT